MSNIVEFDFRSDKTLREINKINNAAKNVQDTVTKSKPAFQDFSNSITGSFLSAKTAIAGVGAAIAAIGIGKAVSEIISLASDQENAINKLNSALKSNELFTDDATASLQDYAKELQNTTTFSDEAILNVQSLAISYGASIPQAKLAAEAATNLASGLGIDLNTAAERVVKTLGGYPGELGETISSLKTLTSEQLKAGDALRLINDEFKGAAFNATQTFSGAISSLKNVFTGFLVNIGDFIIKSPDFIGVIDDIKKVFSDLTLEIKDNEEGLKQLASAGFSALIQSTKFFINILSDLGKAVTSIRKKYDDFKNDIIDLNKKINDTTTNIRIKIFKFFNKDYVDAFKKSQDAVRDLNKEISEMGNSFDKQSLDNNLKSFEESFNKFNKKVTTTKKNVSEVFSTTGEKNALGDTNIKDLQSLLELPAGYPKGPAEGKPPKKKKPQNENGDTGKEEESLFSGITSAITGALRTGGVAGIGGIASQFGPFGQIASLLGTVNKEELDKMIKSLVEGAGQFIENIIENIPVLFESLIESIPRLIKALVRKIPDLIDAIIEGVPDIVSGFITEFVRNIPDLVYKVGEGLVNAIIDLINNALGFIGDIGSGIGDFFEGIFHSGGKVGGSPRSNVPIIAQEGEYVLNRDLTSRLESLFAKEDRQFGRTEVVRTNLTLNNQVFGEIILELNRSGARLA